MQWQFTPYAVPLFVGSVLMSGIAILAWRHRSTHGTLPFMWLNLALLFSVLGYAFELGSPSVSEVRFWLKVQYVGISTTSVLLLLTVLVYTGKQRYLTPLTISILFVVPVITLILVWTMEQHYVHWTAIEIDRSHGYTATLLERGVWWWVHIIYSDLLYIGTLVVIVREYRRAAGLLRRQYGGMLAGVLVGLMAHYAFVVGLAPPGLDTTPYGSTASAVIIAFWMLQYQLFDLMPVARDVVIESMDDAVIVLDQKNRVIDLNPAARRIVSQSTEIIGQPITKAFPNQHNLIEHYDDVPEAHTEITVGQGDAQRQFDLHISTLFRHKNQASGRLIVLRDVTERKQAEQERMELMQERQRTEVLQHFISAASHDLRTPLTTMKTSLFLLKRLNDPEKRKKHMAMLESQTEHLERLLEDMLTMSRLDKVAELEFAPLNLNALLDNIMTRQSTLISEKELSAEFIPIGDLPSINGDSHYLGRALEIIVLNALNYTPKEGTITVRIYEQEQQIMVEVQDSGIGISDEDLPHIFESFYRGDEARNTNTGGTGLGLAMANKIVKLHRGHIEVESEEGKGSTFRVVIPTLNDKS